MKLLVMYMYYRPSNVVLYDEDGVEEKLEIPIPTEISGYGAMNLIVGKICRQRNLVLRHATVVSDSTGKHNSSYHLFYLDHAGTG